MSKEKVWDKEYSTSYINEMIFLKSKGIRYTWVYTNENNISVWRYRKTKELFGLLMQFYENQKYE